MAQNTKALHDRSTSLSACVHKPPFRGDISPGDKSGHPAVRRLAVQSLAMGVSQCP